MTDRDIEVIAASLLAAAAGLRDAVREFLAATRPLLPAIERDYRIGRTRHPSLTHDRVKAALRANRGRR